MNKFEVDGILGHVMIDGELNYYCTWKWHPPKAATFVTVDNMTGCKALLDDYHKSIRALNDNGEVDQQQILATAAKTQPKIYSCLATSIKGHKLEKGKMLYETEFQDGSTIFRPDSAFKENDEPTILKAYKDRTFRRSASRSGRQTDTPRPVQPSASHDDKSCPGASSRRSLSMASHGTPRSTRRRSIVSTPVARPLATASSDDAQDRPGPSRQVVTPKAATGSKRRASVNAPVADKRPRVDDQGEKKVLYVLKNKEGKGEVLFKDSNGVLSRKDIDEAYQNNPKVIFDALKTAFLANS